MALLLLSAPPPPVHVGAIASAAQRLFGSGPDWLSGLAASASAASSARPTAAASPSSSPSPAPPPPAPSSLFPRSLHRFVPPSPPAVLQGPGPSAVVASLGDYGSNTNDPPFLPRRTLAAAAFALAFAAGSSVLAEVWREARILRPPRPAPPPIAPAQQEHEQQTQTANPRAVMVAQLEAAAEVYRREEARLLQRQQGEKGAEDLKERLQEARVVRAALERQVSEQRALLRREEQRAAKGRGRGGAA